MAPEIVQRMEYEGTYVMWKREKRERDEKKKERLNGRGRKMIEERGRMRRGMERIESNYIELN